jgi:uncharacterized membrane protein (UPF0127 family)
MIMEKRVIVGIIVAVIIALLIVNSYTLLPVEDNGEPEQEAHVTFHLENSKSFNVSCEIADEPKERSQGLMHRENLPRDEGLLFVYDTPQNMSFWMKNTLIPLDIIFIDENGIVLNVEEADVQPPGTPDSELIRYRSAGLAQWVVEINQGLSAQSSISAGTNVEIEILE